MKIQKSQKRLLLVLGVVLIYALVDFISNSERYKKYYFTEGNTKSTVVLRKTILTPVKEKGIADQNLSWQRDPFNQLHVLKPVQATKRMKVKPDLKLVLKAITFDGQNSFVMINDVILMEGETIQGYQIDKIYKDNVELSKNGNTKHVYLNSK